MALSLTTTMTIEGNAGEAMDRAAAALRNPQTFMRQVGVLGMSSAALRLSTNLRTDRGVRSGALMSSLGVGAGGRGGTANTVFEVSDFEGEYGTNLGYAAQVHYGGTIVPREAKALAIPLPRSLKLAGLWPRDLDPGRELLQFVPYRGGKPNIIGFLVDAGDEIELRNKKGKLKKKQVSRTGYGPGPLYVLVSSVTQEPNPFLFWSDEDQRVIEEELWPAFLGL